ncbi:MAG: MFS transporter [Anaerolineales bacterium]
MITTSQDVEQSSGDERIDQGSSGERFHINRVLTMAAVHAVHDTYTAFLPPLLPEFISRFLLSKTKAGLLTVFLQVPSLLQPVIGHLSDRVSLRYLVILAPAVTATMMSLLGVAPGYAVLALLLTITGISSAALHAVGPVMVGSVSGPSLGRGMSFWMVGGELGRAFGPIVVVTVVKFLTPEGLPWLMPAGLLASVFLFIRLRNEPGRRPKVNQGLPWRSALKRMRPVMMPLVGIIIVRVFMNSALTTFLPIFLIEQGADLWFAGASLTILQAAGVLGAMLGGSISDRLGRRLVLFISLMTTPIFMFVFLAVSGWAQITILPLLGLTSISVTPVLLALVQENFPENRALANGIYMALGFTLRSGAVVVMGALGDLFSLRQAFTASAVLMLLGVPLILLLPSERRKIDMEK